MTAKRPPKLYIHPEHILLSTVPLKDPLYHAQEKKMTTAIQCNLLSGHVYPVLQ